MSETPERRRRQRVRDGFRVKLGFLRNAARRGALRGTAKDYDGEGICVKTSSPLPVGKQVRIRFRIPRSLSPTLEGLSCRLPARVRLVRPEQGPPGRYEMVLRWEDPLNSLVSGAMRRHKLKVGAVIVVMVAATLFMKFNSLQSFWYTPLLYAYSFMVALYFLSRFLLSWLHTDPEMTDYEPTVTVVIAARNEAESIGRTIEAVFASHYPKEKLEVIAVNDGSTDGTGEAMEATRKQHPELRIFTLPPSGKRHGMATGVRNGKGELIVFVDSDTFLHPTALRYIVCGFEDPRLGASAGHTDVENLNVNYLTGMQDVRYFVSFRMMKSSESLFGTVTCCPGCLSAYRRSYLLEVLDPWLNQRFLGAKATFGDDRSLTNFILRKYRVIYNTRATCTTVVPETWKRYLTQQVRWKKSWLRETMIAARYMYKKHPLAALSFYTTSVGSILSPLLVFRAFWISFGPYSEQDSFFVYYMLGLMTIGFLQCLYYLGNRPNSRWLLGMLLMAAQITLMGPQTYYAMLTMRKNHWGTR